MHIAQFFVESEELPKDVTSSQVVGSVYESLGSTPAMLTECDVTERLVTRNGETSTERICAVSIIYPALREVEEVFSDIKMLDKTGFNFSRSDTRGISARIPEIHPTLSCSVHKSWGRVDGYENCRPPDRTQVSVCLYGALPSEEARATLTEIADRVFEPRQIEPGKYESERSFGKSSGSTPEIEVYRVWPVFDMHIAGAFAQRVRDIDKHYHITNPDLLTQESEDWIQTRYPPAIITGNFWRDQRNDIYWLHFQVSLFVYYN